MKTIDIWGAIKPEEEIMYYTDFSSSMMNHYLSVYDGEDIKVRIQSVGGSVWEGVAIYELLLAYSKNVTTEIMGICGSIGSIIFLGGKERIAHETSSFFVHEARGGSADDIKKINELMANIYSANSNKNVDFWLDAMKKNTTFMGKEILELGIATKLEGRLSAVALLDFYENQQQQQQKEPQMAMTQEEKAQFEALKAENLEMKAKAEVKEKENETLKAELAEKSEDAIKAKIEAGIKAEQDRVDAIKAFMMHDKQAELVAKLITDKTPVIEAKLAIAENFKAEGSAWIAQSPVAVLEGQAPAAAKPTGDGGLTDGDVYNDIKSLKAQGKFDEANKLFNKHFQEAK